MKKIIIIYFCIVSLAVQTYSLAQPTETLENITVPFYPDDPVLENEVAKIRGESNEQLFGKTMKLFQEKEYGKSIAYCLKALTINPDDYKANTIMGMNYAMKGDFKKAVAYFQKATNVYPEQHISIAFMGIFSPEDENYRKNFYKAIDDYKNKISNNPNDYQAYNDLAYLSFILRVDQKFAEYYKKSIEIKPDYAQAHYNLALYYLIYKDRKLALEECKILEKLNPDLAKTILRTLELIEKREKEDKKWN